MPSDYIPILIQIAIIIGFGAVMLILTHLVGPKNPNPDKLDVYECGVPPYENLPARFSVKFYMIAVLYVLFDIEAIFLYPLATVYHQFIAMKPSAAVYIFLEMLVFIGILFAGLIYAWKRGALEWE